MLITLFLTSATTCICYGKIRILGIFNLIYSLFYGTFFLEKPQNKQSYLINCADKNLTGHLILTL
jgi:hypothetical protein